MENLGPAPVFRLATLIVRIVPIQVQAFCLGRYWRELRSPMEMFVWHDTCDICADCAMCIACNTPSSDPGDPEHCREGQHLWTMEPDDARMRTPERLARYRLSPYRATMLDRALTETLNALNLPDRNIFHRQYVALMRGCSAFDRGWLDTYPRVAEATLSPTKRLKNKRKQNDKT